MMHILLDTSGKTKAVFDDGDLVVGDREVRDWFTNGVPSMQGKMDAKGNIVEVDIRVGSKSPLFGLALLDHVEELGLSLVEADVQKSMSARTPVTLRWQKSQGAPGSVGGGGANIQMGLPPKPVNPHDVTGVQAYLRRRVPEDSPRITRDPRDTYEYNEAIDWVHPIADARNNYKNVIVPDETENFADENKQIVRDVSTQVTDSVMNKPAAPHWGPAPYTGPRYPAEADEDRIIEEGGSE